MEVNNNSWVTERGAGWGMSGEELEWCFPPTVLATSEALGRWTETLVKESLVLRPLHRGDWAKGYGPLLSQLTTLGPVAEADFHWAVAEMGRAGRELVVVAAADEGRGQVVASATLCLEQKVIHGCAKRGRIEDVVVDDGYRGKGLGRLLVDVLTDLAKTHKAYKVSLECKDALLPFYAKLGYHKDQGNNFCVMRF